MGISALALRIRYPEPLDLSSSLDLPPVAVSAMGKYGRQIVWAPKNGKQYAWMVQEMFIMLHVAVVRARACRGEACLAVAEESSLGEASFDQGPNGSDHQGACCFTHCQVSGRSAA